MTGATIGFSQVAGAAAPHQVKAEPKRKTGVLALRAKHELVQADASLLGVVLNDPRQSRANALGAE